MQRADFDSFCGGMAMHHGSDNALDTGRGDISFNFLSVLVHFSFAICMWIRWRLKWLISCKITRF
jgi:hypothetical protein